MNRGKDLLFRILTGLLITVLMITALIAGYKFITSVNLDAKDKFHEVAKEANDKAKEKTGIDISKLFAEEPDFEYKRQNTRTYSGKRLYEEYRYIFTDDGDVLTDFLKDNGYSLNMITDVDRKYGIVEDDGKCYLINADLEVRLVAERCLQATINYEGTHVGYCNSDGVFIYDIETEVTTCVSDHGFSMCISPDGRTVAFYENRFKSRALCVAGLDIEKTIIESTEDGFYTARAVSNDANTVFYEKREGKNRHLYCCHDQRFRDLSRAYGNICYFDRECTEVIFYDYDEIYYYNSKENVLRKIIDDNKIMKAQLKDEIIEREIICETKDRLRKLAVNGDLSEGLFGDESGDFPDVYKYDLMSFTWDGEVKMIIEANMNESDGVKWNRVFDRYYYTADNDLYCINSDGSDNKLILEDFKYFDYIPGTDSPIIMVGQQDEKYVIIDDTSYLVR